MKKTLIIAIMAITLLISLVSAEESILRLTNVISRSAESQGTTLSFITGTSGQPRVGDIKTWSNPGLIPTTMGEACSDGQYVVAYQCEYIGANCQRMFTDDWKKTSSSDLLPYANWQNELWFKEVLVYKKYSAYECLAATANPVNEAPLYQNANGAFLTVALPGTGWTNEYVTIRGSYKVTSEGWFILEGGINRKVSTTLAVITASSSSCDGSGYYAGQKLYGKPGDIYDFSFIVKVPSIEGYYGISAYTYTDCFSNGGKEIAIKSGTIQVKKPLISMGTGCGSIDTDGDGVNDGCDACPKDYGISTNQGCHPCFGMGDSPAMRKCYYDNQDKYGIPIIILDIIDPYVNTITECTNSNTQVATIKIRQSGLRSTLPTKTTCISPQVCVQATTQAASCQTPKPVAPTATEKQAICENGDKVIYQLMSDGSKINQGTFPCAGNGCENGACLQQPQDPAQTGIEDSAAQLQDLECTSINDCKPGEYCDAAGKCIIKELTGCKSNTECTDPAKPVCSLTAGICTATTTPECAIDADCKNLNLKCQDTYCIPINAIIDNSTILEGPCTENKLQTCSDGSKIMTGKCEAGKLYVLSNNCVAITTKTSTTQSVLGGFFSSITSALSPSKTATTTPKTNWLLIGIVVLAVVAGLFIIKNTSPKGKKKFSLKKILR
jgi:hypothetical protein